MRRPNVDVLIACLGGAMLAAGVVAGLMMRLGSRRIADARMSLPQLAKAIVGNSRTVVAAVLGPPRIATFVGSERPVRDYRDADVWYYPIPRVGRMGMAIRFSNGNAETVEFFDAPRR
ncbi:MAG TPA: hypothetical protein VGN72_02315 [Tepidisphaeraceae bacterium]|jgi:hypothetical protein|nr:hypothetical protein [Tepidisphaeraceae bacterium]